MKILLAALVLFAVVAPSFAIAKPTTGEILSNVSKTRSEISMTFARNARA